MNTKTIVLAWTETVMIPDGQPVATDLGAQPNMIKQVKAYACIWLNKGDQEDTVKARTHVTAEHPLTGRIYCYTPSTKDPLGKACRAIIKKTWKKIDNRLISD